VTGFHVDPDDVLEIVATLAAIPGLDATTGDPPAPAQVVEIGQPVELPGVCVQVSGYTFDALDSYTMRGRLLLVVGDRPAPEARTALADLLNLVATAFPVKGEVTHEAIVLPDRPGSPLPCLAVPFIVRCSPARSEV
jgi:hypothetical protein